VSTSEQYNFQNTPSEQLIVDAYERIGFVPSLITAQKIISAQRLLNLILSEWINRGLNLWTVRFDMLGLSPNVTSYKLTPKVITDASTPTAVGQNTVTDILEATIRNSNRVTVGGSAIASGTIALHPASSAFDGNPATYCTVDTTNGWLGYNFTNLPSVPTAPQLIQLIGITSQVDATYTLVVEYSDDGITWATPPLMTIPSFPYPKGQLIWFALNLSQEYFAQADPLQYQIYVQNFGSNYIRIRETNNATLSINELYFNNSINDLILTRISRSEYMTYPNKENTGRPSLFYLDRQRQPVVNLYLTPSQQYNCMFYSYASTMQDAGTMLDEAEIPNRFLEPLTAALAYKLSIKEITDLNKIQLLKSESDEQFKRAAEEDTERVPLRVYGDYSRGYTVS
jgi:hypothetical protein